MKVHTTAIWSALFFAVIVASSDGSDSDSDRNSDGGNSWPFKGKFPFSGKSVSKSFTVTKEKAGGGAQYCHSTSRKVKHRDGSVEYIDETRYDLHCDAGGNLNVDLGYNDGSRPHTTINKNYNKVGKYM